MIVWDAGTVVSGAGSIGLLGRYVYTAATVIPETLSRVGADPPYYISLGRIGPMRSGIRGSGVTVHWPNESYERLPDEADSLWYRLANGVTATIYRGVDVSTDQAIGCRVYATTNQTIPNNSGTTVTFDAERFDHFNMHSASTNPSRITVPAPGWYMIGGQVRFAASATGQRYIFIKRNGTEIAAHGAAPNPGGSFTTTYNISCLYYLSEGDYLELSAQQDSGGNLDLVPTGERGNEFWAVRIG